MRIGNIYIYTGAWDGVNYEELTAWIGVVHHTFGDVTTYIFLGLRITIDNRKDN